MRLEYRPIPSLPDYIEKTELRVAPCPLHAATPMLAEALRELIIAATLFRDWPKTDTLHRLPQALSVSRAALAAAGVTL